MKRNAFAGTGKVFHFTFRQLLKSKANRRSLLVMLLIALISVPALSLIRGGSNGGGSDTFLIDNQTTLSLSGLAGRLEEEGVGTMQEASADLRDKADLRITDSPDGLIVTQLTGSAYGSVSYAAQITAQFLKEQQLLAAGLSEAAVNVLAYYPDTYIMTDEEYAEFSREKADDPSGSSISDDPAGPAEEDEGFDQGSYMVQLGLSVLLMMVSILSVSFVIRAVVEEKQSKLVDLLLVSVEPGALLLGKVLASLLYALLYYVVLIGGALISRTVSGLFMDTSGTENYLTNVLKLDLGPDVLAVLLITSLLGFLAFGILGGICGAGCSSIEDSGGAMSLCMLLIMAGYMVSIFATAGGLTHGNAAKAFSIIPVISMFSAPTLYMYGKVGFGPVAIGWAVQLFFILLLTLLAAKVYSGLIIYKGKRLSLGNILRMARGKEVRV